MSLAAGFIIKKSGDNPNVLPQMNKRTNGVCPCDGTTLSYEENTNTCCAQHRRPANTGRKRKQPVTKDHSLYDSADVKRPAPANL